jgi:hypothetical protein
MDETHQHEDFLAGYFSAQRGEPFWLHNSPAWIDGWNFYRGVVVDAASPRDVAAIAQAR